MFGREVCEEDVIRRSVPIGGPGIRVQIDETKVGKRKFNRGRRMDGQWVFGGSEEFDWKKIFLSPSIGSFQAVSLSLTTGRHTTV